VTQVKGIDPDLSLDRQLATLVQVTAQERGLDIGPIDGLWGPRTDRALRELVQRSPEE
jgi:hypothetical protein